MASSPPLPDLVRLSQLDTQFSSSPEYTQHIQYVPENTRERRRVRKEERWKKIRRLGRGAFGDVWLEQCFQGDTKGEVRAVKKIQKLDRDNYYRELEAIALFSHNKYEQCFVKSFGWYDDSNSIYIAMEFLPNGDLHQQLTSPLPESECQAIVLQVLEGLDFMHQNGFTHRDLKPANILVASKGPDWWVKIADFGISKRTIAELTVLRTQTGTPAFAAPEVFGFAQSESYTNAVDIWSLGVITFFILTGETLFKDQRRLAHYATGRFAFPLDNLLVNKISVQGCDFTRALMAPEPEDRPKVGKCLQQPWLSSLVYQTSKAQSNTRLTHELRLPETKSYNSNFEASARWSTSNQTLPYRSTSRRVDNVEFELPALLEPEDQFSTFKAHAQEKMLSPKSAITESAAKSGFEVVYQKLPATLKGHSDWVYGIAFSPDGKVLASGSEDKTVRLWDPATGACQATLKGHSDGVYRIAFSPDGKVLASGSKDKTVRLWDPATGACQATLKGHSDGVYGIAFSPDGKVLASGSKDKTVRLWDPATGACQATLKGHSDGVYRIAFSPDGKVLASGSPDKTVRLWDPNDPKKAKGIVAKVRQFF